METDTRTCRDDLEERRPSRPPRNDRLALPAQLAEPLVRGTFRTGVVNLDGLDIIYTASHCKISRVAFLSLIGRDTPGIHGVRIV
jgi:hypothetical protein